MITNKITYIYTTILIQALIITHIQSKGIAAGAGYSSDMQQIAPNICFNSTISSISEKQGYEHLDSSMAFSDLQSDLNIDVSTKGGFKMFSADLESKFMRHIEEKDYSLSLSYYQSIQETVELTLGGFNTSALNSAGQSFYNGSKNIYFNLDCGDNYITSYQQGGLLIMNLNIAFSSNYDKTEFSLHVGTSFGSMFQASADISKASSSLHIQGTVSITAYQIGGDPSQISKILSKDSSGDYYILKCSLASMDDCTKAADGLLDYAQNQFSTQFTSNSSMTLLGDGFIKYQQIKYIGLTEQDSFVTSEVVDARIMLAEIYNEMNYYEQKMNELLILNEDGIPWETSSNLYRNMTTFYTKVQENIKVLTDQSTGAVNCYNSPDNCMKIKQEIIQQRINVLNTDFLKEIEYMYDIYSIPPCPANFQLLLFKTGDLTWNGYDCAYYFPQICGINNKHPVSFGNVTVHSMSINETTAEFDITDRYGLEIVTQKPGLISKDGGVTYNGFCTYFDPFYYSCKLNRLTSFYYFAPFQNSSRDKTSDKNKEDLKLSEIPLNDIFLK